MAKAKKATKAKKSTKTKKTTNAKSATIQRTMVAASLLDGIAKSMIPFPEEQNPKPARVPKLFPIENPPNGIPKIGDIVKSGLSPETQVVLGYMSAHVAMANYELNRTYQYMNAISEAYQGLLNMKFTDAKSFEAQFKKIVQPVLDYSFDLNIREKSKKQ